MDPQEYTADTALNSHLLAENLARLIRTKVSERIIYPKGSGAFGTFTVTNNISDYSSAKIFSSTGNQCKIFARFSSLNPDRITGNDNKGFSLRFYTEDGNWDLVCSSSPVFYVKNAAKFSQFIRAQKRNPRTNQQSAADMWDYFSQNPESLHSILMTFSDRGQPLGYRHMHGYSAHTYALFNNDNERFWVRFHIKTRQNTKNFGKENTPSGLSQEDFAHKDLVDAIARKDFPKWTVFMQVMTEDEAKDFRWNPFDVTKVWFHEDFPLIEVGEIELNQIPADYFQEVEQAAFSPANIVAGIGFSPDPLLQLRLSAYGDAQRYRIGSHASSLPVNRCPLQQNSSENRNDRNDFNNEPYLRAFDDDNDYYSQPGLFYTKALDEACRNTLAENLIAHMKKIDGPSRSEIISRQLCHFFRANIELGMKIAMGLQFNINSEMLNHTKD